LICQSQSSGTASVYSLSLHDALPICTLVRTRVNEVSVLGRNTKGVTLIKVDAKEKLVGVERICDTDEEDSDALEAGVINGESTEDRKSTRLNSSHVKISYAVFCLDKK